MSASGFDARIEDAVVRIGGRLLEESRGQRRWWQRFTDEDILLEKLMRDEALRTTALRFVDVLPALVRDEDLGRHLEEYFDSRDLHLPWPALTHWGLHQARSGLGAHLVAPMVRAVVGRMARRFIAGRDARDAALALQRLWRMGMGFTVDLLGEAVVSEPEALEYQRQCLAMLDELAPLIRTWPAHALIDHLNGRISPRLNLSVKVSALYSRMDPIDPEGSISVLRERLCPILARARACGAFVTLDMEQYAFKDLTLRLFRDLALDREFSDWPDFGLAMQAYLRQTPGDLRQLIDWARKRPAPVMVRLVRGAYWDYETIIARQNGWPVPVWSTKPETDACYEQCLDLLLQAHPHVETAVATHNVRSMALAMALAGRYGLSAGQYEFQMLYGMADEVKGRLVAEGQRLRVYTPIGQMLPGMAYLVRRLLENTASQSFLRMGFSENRDSSELLAPPQWPVSGPDLVVETVRPATFSNVPLRRFVSDGERADFAAAIRQVESELGRSYGLVIGGCERETSASLVSINPDRPDQVVGRTACAGVTEADAAVLAAEKAFDAWRRTPAEQRAEVLLRAAELLRSRRDLYAAWEIFEAGKTWREADADVAETIDFMEFYAREGLRHAAGYRLDVAGELNHCFAEPRGPGAVIAPWNFPLAIPVGMLSAAVVCGNTVVLKPAPQTPVILAHFCRLLKEAGLPEGVVNYLPGQDEAGRALVAHSGVHFVAFTGSLGAGKHILEQGVRLMPGQHHFKHVIAELGGKNAIIVDSDADLDDAILGVVASAFGFAGQKCSAASRLIVVDPVYEEFIERLAQAASSLRCGSPVNPGTDVGPVIDAEARARILQAIDQGRTQGRLVHQADVSGLGAGYHVGPTIFAGVSPDSPLFQEEIFGPVLAAVPAASFEQALALANACSYALTGGVYSRSPAHLALARREFRVGNLYLNRKITGAIVNRQPFGGFRLSGTNARAGGPEYLGHFVHMRCITENTLRRGFSPDSFDSAASPGPNPHPAG